MNDFIPNNRSIDEQIQDFYEDQALPTELLNQLCQTVNNKSPQTKRWYLRNYWQTAFTQVPAFVAVILLLITITTTTLYWQAQINERQHINNVAAEIALNHTQNFRTEYNTPNISTLATEMTLLDFTPVQPMRLQNTTYNIDGARYCTIDNTIAVQIHMQDEAQQDFTLYQFRNNLDISIEKEQTIIVEDVQVTLWREGDIVMGLAEQKEKDYQTCN